jgi:hypothetical protein
MNKAILNRGTILQTGFDSGRLTPLCVVIHGFPTAGEFLATVYQDANPIGKFRLSISRDSANKQVNIDLATLLSGEPRQAGAQTDAQFDLQSGGSALFYVSSTRGGNAVVINPAGTPNQVVFDSRSLDKGDIFLVTLLRPGQYKLTNAFTKIESQVKVLYPAATEAPVKKLALQTTNVGPKQFGAAAVELQAVQGLAVRCDTPSRLLMQITQTFEKPPAAKGGGGVAKTKGKAEPAKTTVVQALRPNKVTWRKPMTGN